MALEFGVLDCQNPIPPLEIGDSPVRVDGEVALDLREDFERGRACVMRILDETTLCSLAGLDECSGQIMEMLRSLSFVDTFRSINTIHASGDEESSSFKSLGEEAAWRQEVLVNVHNIQTCIADLRSQIDRAVQLATEVSQGIQMHRAIGFGKDLLEGGVRGDRVHGAGNAFNHVLVDLELMQSLAEKLTYEIGIVDKPRLESHDRRNHFLNKSGEFFLHLDSKVQALLEHISLVRRFFGDTLQGQSNSSSLAKAS